MRLLHTSDWHLGRNFGPFALLDDQARFCDWFVELAVAEGVDLVVIAGDLYDRAIPPTEAVALLRTTLGRLAAAGIRVVAIAGNHDSAERVSAADGLTDAAGVIVRGGYARASDTITFDFDDGPLDVVAVPYLDPVLHPDPGAHTHQSVLDAALAAAVRRSPRSVAAVHGFVAGGLEADSERVLSVGGADRIGVGTFHGFSYAALGHLHNPQLLNRDTRRYSGSPLAYSFSETRQKEVVLVELDAAGAARVEPVPITLGRPVATIRGSLDDLLGAVEHDAVAAHFVRAVLTDPGHVLDAKLRLQRRFDFVTEIVLEPAVDAAARAPQRERLRMTPLAAADGFWSAVTSRRPDDAERSEIEQVLAAAAAEAPR